MQYSPPENVGAGGQSSLDIGQAEIDGRPPAVVPGMLTGAARNPDGRSIGDMHRLAFAGWLLHQFARQSFCNPPIDPFVLMNSTSN